MPAVADPQGRLVPDDRGPAFRIPAWVTPPDFLRPHLEARAAVGLGDVPYTVEKALHFSNGGGVYLGRDTRTGEQVVLKEARPYAGLAAETRAERAFAALPGALVVVAHRLSSARRADRILVMDGLRTRCGTSAELLRVSALYRDLAGLWEPDEEPRRKNGEPDAEPRRKSGEPDAELRRKSGEPDTRLHESGVISTPPP